MENSSWQWQQVEQQARNELAEEERRKLIEQVKEKLRNKPKHPWWVKWFPYRIKIERIV